MRCSWPPRPPRSRSGAAGSATGGRLYGWRRRRASTAASTSAASCFPQSSDGDGGNWSVDYPRADINLSIRLSELTRTRISRDSSGEPNHVLLRLTDDLLFQCPFIMMTEVGNTYFSPQEAERLREYLLKGGFLWADDFWGTWAWEVWAREIGKVLPPSEYPIVDVPAHPSDLPSAVRRQTRHSDSVDRDVARARRRHLGARPGQRRRRTRARSSTSTAT